MTDPAAVRAALARLADPGQRSVERPERVVRRAVAVTDDVDRAATFVADGGLERLEAAVEAAERAGDDHVADRGRRVLSTFDAFADACDAEDPTCRESVGRRDDVDDPAATGADGDASGGRDPACTARRDERGSVPPRSRNP